MPDDKATTPVRSPGSSMFADDDTKPWDASGLIRGTVEELGRMLDAKHVISEPMTFGQTTVVPLVSVGFAFGAGGGGGSGTSPEGKGGQNGEGGGGGGGAGGGVKPIAVLIIQEGSVRLERIPDAPSGLDKLGAAVAHALERRGASSGSHDDD